MHDPKMPDLEKPATSMRGLRDLIHQADSRNECMLVSAVLSLVNI